VLEFGYEEASNRGVLGLLFFFLADRCESPYKSPRCLVVPVSRQILDEDLLDLV